MDRVEEVSPSVECRVDTEKGVVRGERCPKGDTLFHRTSTETAENIVESGEVRQSEEVGVVSLSSNPSHFFGGKFRFHIDPDKVDTRPMCYIERGTESEDKFLRLEKEARDESEEAVFNSDRFRAETGVNSKNAYGQECEYMSDDAVPVSAVEKVDYWVPWKGTDGQVSCSRAHPQYVQLSSPQVHESELREDIEEAKRVAERLGVPFEVKSCFKSAKTGWNDHAKLNEENLKRLERGEPLKEEKGDPPGGCRC